MFHWICHALWLYYGGDLGKESWITRWWFQIFFHVHPYLGRWSNLTHVFQLGWNHQLHFSVYFWNVLQVSFSFEMFLKPFRKDKYREREGDQILSGDMSIYRLYESMNSEVLKETGMDGWTSNRISTNMTNINRTCEGPSKRPKTHKAIGVFMYILVCCLLMFVALFLTSLYNARNCRFLIDPVPREQIDWTMRRHCKDFCEAVAKKQEYRVPREEYEDWMPTGRAGDELFCFQVNARKDGHLLLERCCFHVFWGEGGGCTQKSCLGSFTILTQGKHAKSPVSR